MRHPGRCCVHRQLLPEASHDYHTQVAKHQSMLLLGSVLASVDDFAVADKGTPQEHKETACRIRLCRAEEE